jgi:hypothetical protein
MDAEMMERARLPVERMLEMSKHLAPVKRTVIKSEYEGKGSIVDGLHGYPVRIFY